MSLTCIERPVTRRGVQPITGRHPRVVWRVGVFGSLLPLRLCRSAQQRKRHHQTHAVRLCLLGWARNALARLEAPYLAVHNSPSQAALSLHNPYCWLRCSWSSLRPGAELAIEADSGTLCSESTRSLPAAGIAPLSDAGSGPRPAVAASTGTAACTSTVVGALTINWHLTGLSHKSCSCLR